MADKKSPPAEIARLALERLRGLADPVKAKGVQRYFKDCVRAYGISAPAVRELAAGLYRSITGSWTARDAMALCDILFAEPELESKAVGELILARFKKDLPTAFFAKAKGWLAADLLDNWASVDGLCPDAMGAFLERNPGYVAKIKAWAFHPNRWVRRAAAVSFIKLAKKEEFLGAVYEIAASLFAVEDDLIHKAAGWLLREAGKRDPERLARFLLEHGPAVPRTTLRYAIERFPLSRRKALLLETKTKRAAAPAKKWTPRKRL
jgi:3-methyladenine DNA glycosylase AlkD